MNIIFSLLSVVYIRQYFTLLSLFEFDDIDEPTPRDEDSELLSEILGENINSNVEDHAYKQKSHRRTLFRDCPGCFNHYELCDFWMKKGECNRNKKFMWKYCEGSCNPLCEGRAIGVTDVDCTDDHKLCPKWASIGECDNNPLFMMWNCRKSCHPRCANTFKDL